MFALLQMQLYLQQRSREQFGKMKEGAEIFFPFSHGHQLCMKLRCAEF